MARQGKKAMGEEVKKQKVEKPKAGVDEKPKDAMVEAKPKYGEEKKEELPPPPPEEVEMRVYMHYKGCALKVKKILKCFNGVEDVFVDSKMHKVVVKGKKVAADPSKVVEYVQKKTGHKVELVSAIPPPLEEKKEEEIKEEPEPPKLKEEEPPVIQVVLKVHIHCEVCAQWIKKRILKMKGVQYAELDLKASEVTVKGVLEEAKLVKYMYKCIGKHVSIIKSELVASLDSAGGDDMAKEEEKVEDVEKEKEGDGDTGGEDKDKVDKEMEAKAIATANLYMHYPQFEFPGGYYSSPTLLLPGYMYQAAYPPPSYTALCRTTR